MPLFSSGEGATKAPASLGRGRPAIVRGSALSLLDQYLGPAAMRALRSSLRDPDALVRRAAVGVLSAAEPRTRETLGLSLVRQQRLRDAVPELAKAAQLRPDTPRYAYVYGVALYQTGRIRQALRVLAETHERRPADRDILAALAEYHRQEGDRQGAIAWARKLVEVSAGDPQARRLLESLQRLP